MEYMIHVIHENGWSTIHPKRNHKKLVMSIRVQNAVFWVSKLFTRI